ncbi:solute symporter family protein [Gandjariella thermophila]|uniref:Cation acetate symporter n=1 Tax=Gandjariella thermophila TaxID=1931992 RepID=A0A4D4J389_9PSEU|nr:cation acetate symporter [Gandjariella thermophila]GDY29542.1 cation acetate symporter [Gandjariella thermophila]
MTVQIAAPVSGNPTLNVGIFVVFVAITLYIVYRASSRNTTAADYYAAGGGFTGVQNGIAMSGDFLSAASFLGISGAIAVHGYDGFLYSIGWVVAWLLSLMLMAEMLRNTGRFTMGDVMSFRMNQRPVRAAAAVSTLVISLFYMLAQTAGAGGLVALLLNVNSKVGQSIVIVIVGLIMIFYVLVGGMKGTTWVQIIKAALLLLSVTMVTVFMLGKFGFSFSALLERATENSPLGQGLLGPGGSYGKSNLTKIDFVSLALALVLGTSSLPHVLMRFYTVPNAKEARRSVVWATWCMFVFYLSTLVIGYGATALVGSSAILHAPGGENSAAPLLAFTIGGTVLLGIVAAVAFATILAVIAGLTITASASFAHDVYANVMRRGQADTRSEVRVARMTAIVIGVLAIFGGILANGQNIAFLVSLAFAIAASANLPTILYSLYWRRFNTTGTLWSIYGGLGSCLVLIVFSPTLSGTSKSIFPSVDFHWFPLDNPGLVSIPFSFLCGLVGTLVGGESGDSGKQAEMEVRALTGIGVGT